MLPLGRILGEIMKVFIIESGSTKSDWILLENGIQVSEYATLGFNPFFCTSEFIVQELYKNEGLSAHANDVQEIYFYGSGCSSAIQNEVIRKGLTSVFTSSQVNVDHDLVACAYATYQGRPAISCILGTGSNSCYFDGEKVTEVVPALGYILGDEGSGSYFGKRLLTTYLYHQLPGHVAKDFETTYGFDKQAILDRVYLQPNPNVFIASFMPFIAKHSEDPFFQTLIIDGFRHFMEAHVCCYPNYKEADLHFAGSIAGIFQASLHQAAESLGLTITSVVGKPAEGLVNYHLKYLLKS